MPVFKGLPKLAISLSDLDKIPSALRQKVMVGRIVLVKKEGIDGVVKEPKVIAILDKEPVVELKCENEQALLSSAIVCDIIRNYNRSHSESISRVYLCRTKWSKIGSEVLLTVKEGNTSRWVLNSEIFGSIVGVVSSTSNGKVLEKSDIVLKPVRLNLD
jgi:hypothetical protein